MPKIRKTVSKVKALWSEIKVCEEKIKSEVIPVMQKTISHYVGEPVGSGNFEVRLNDVFPIVQQKLPFLFFRLPRAFVKPRRPHVFINKFNSDIGRPERVRVEGPKLARTTEQALNWNLHESGFEESMDEVSLDLALAPYAVMYQSYAGEFGIRQDDTMFVKKDSIFQKRIRPDLFLWDVEGNKEEEWRWCGYKYLARLQDVIDDPRYSKTDELDGKTGFGNVLRMTDQGSNTRVATMAQVSNFLDPSFKESVQSKRVWLYEIWEKPSLKDRLKGKPGRVYVFAEGVEDPIFQDDWPLKQEGFPFEVFRINPLNDSMQGIADPTTYIELAKQKQLETDYILKNLKQNSNLKVVLDGSKFDAEDIEKFTDGRSGVLISKQSLVAGSVTPIQAGSVPSAAFEVAQRTDLQLQKQSSITQTRLGIKPPGEQTATQAEILEKGLEARPTIHQKLISRSLRKLMRKRIQLMKQFFKREDIVPILGTFDFEWSDSFSNKDIIDEVDVEVEVVSMLPENPSVEIRNLLDMLRLMTEAMSNPAVFTKIQQEGKIFNFSPFIEQVLLRMNLRDEEMFRPIRPEDGEGFSSNATLLNARQRAMQAVLGGQASPPQPGENHDIYLSVYQSVMQLLQALGLPQEQLAGLVQLIQQTVVMRQQEESKSGAKKAGTPLKQSSKNGGVPTRASEAARAQGRVQRV